MSSEVKFDYPVEFEFVQTLKSALEKEDFKSVENILKENPDAIIELSNDDWMKDPSVQLPPAILVGES